MLAVESGIFGKRKVGGLGAKVGKGLRKKGSEFVFFLKKGRGA